MTKQLLNVLILATVVSGTSQAWANSSDVKVNPALKENLWYMKPNFSKLEADVVAGNYPNINIDYLNNMTREKLEKMSQDQLDNVYALLPSGPIPYGKFNGSVIVARGGPMDFIRRSLGEKWGNYTIGALERLGETIWKGKVFNNQTGVLQNRITFKPDFFEKDAEAITNPFLKLAFQGAAQTFELAFSQMGERLWFPAKLYCGQSKLDSRRESVIIDYAYNETLEGVEGMYGQGPAYGGNLFPALRKPIDEMVGRKGMNVRDEIRMVRPGLYLGRAYLKDAFVLNFALEIEDPKEPGSVGESRANSCWSGKQKGLVAGN